eukprot:TRINITY_DN9129_c0_g7_i1.p1 TRINITY_DN9129_c0_g7~~TRINITY_DN9129_c0_g7_i1.p1  ORF type:complete len:355 (+),score=109.44 TRINITY_DN9129_c0_g7_i1:111-1175(+)
MAALCFVAAAAAAAADPFQRLGAIDYKSYESTPLLFGGRLLLAETITLAYPGHISHWDPAFASCYSYFRVREMATGAVLRNVTESCGHSFGSAFVDTLGNGTEVLWIFGSKWSRKQADWGGAAPDWGGPCSEPANCSVGAFWTRDPTLAVFSSGVAVVPGASTWNVDVARGGPGVRYVMAAEQHPRPGAPPGSGWTTYFYVNDAADGMLAGGWRALAADKVIGGPGTHGACPSIRYVKEDGYYYVVSGGLSVYLDRSRNLTAWEPAAGGAIMKAEPAADTSVCTEYIGYHPTPDQQRQLSSPTWDVDVSDVDFWDLGDGTTVFFYLFGNQGNTIYSALGRYNGTLAAWFQSWYG